MSYKTKRTLMKYCRMLRERVARPSWTELIWDRKYGHQVKLHVYIVVVILGFKSLQQQRSFEDHGLKSFDARDRNEDP